VLAARASQTLCCPQVPSHNHSEAPHENDSRLPSDKTRLSASGPQPDDGLPAAWTAALAPTALRLPHTAPSPTTASPCRGPPPWPPAR